MAGARSRGPSSRPRAARTPAGVPTDGLVPDAQGSRLRQDGRGQPRHAAWPLHAPGSGRSGRRSWRATASTYEGVDEPAPEDPAALAGAGARRTSDRRLRAAAGRGARALALGPAAGDRRDRARGDPGLLGCLRRRRVSSTTRHHRLPSYPRRALQGSPARSTQPRRRWAPGAPGSMHSRSATTAGRCSSPARPTWPSRPTSPASAKDLEELPGWAGTSATRTRGCPAAAGDHRVHQRRHPGRHGVGQLRRGPGRGRSTATGAPARPTARSPTSSTGRCASSARWPRTASCGSGKVSVSRATRARRRPRTRGRTSASSSPA